jgi:hypothetical protein
VNKYNENLVKVGINDSRVRAGISLLSKTYGFRLLGELIPQALEVLRGSREQTVYHDEIRMLIQNSIDAVGNQSVPILVYSVMKIISELLI